MSDMLETIVPNSNQLNYDDFVGKKTMTIKIKNVVVRKTKQQPVSIFYEGDNGRPYLPSKGMRVVIVECWGKEKEAYFGRYLKLFGNPKVKWKGKESGGIQIAELSHIEKQKTVKLTISNEKREDFTVFELSALDILKCDGEIAAKKGTADFVTWGKNLSAEQKASLGDYLKELTLIAKNADSKG